eukprot:Em0012g227a
MHRAITAKTEVVHHRCSVKLFQWEMHSDQECKPMTFIQVTKSRQQTTAASSEDQVLRNADDTQCSQCRRANGPYSERGILSTIEIGAAETLAIKAGLAIPWNKLRLLRRWLKSSGICLAGEERMCQISCLIVGDNLKGEIAPFSFPLPSGGEEVKGSPLVYIPHLVDMVVHLLDENERAGLLTWHNGYIPAIHNTCVFCCFEAGDSVTNLHVALDRFKDQVEHLHGMKWRQYTVKIFMCGDYEFLSKMYGLSGASVKSSCRCYRHFTTMAALPVPVLAPAVFPTPDLHDFKYSDLFKATEDEISAIAWCQNNGLIAKDKMDYVIQDELQFQLGIEGEHTIVDWKNFCRDICLEYFIRNPVVIGGPGQTVEIDECLLVRRKYNVGHQATELFQPLQFGVACPSGTEKVIHGLRTCMEEHWEDDDYAVVKVDMRNTFNLVSRQALLDECAIHFPELLPWASWRYGSHPLLWHPLGHLSSQSGVQQAAFAETPWYMPTSNILSELSGDATVMSKAAEAPQFQLLTLPHFEPRVFAPSLVSATQMFNSFLPPSEAINAEALLLTPVTQKSLSSKLDDYLFKVLLDMSSITDKARLLSVPPLMQVEMGNNLTNHSHTRPADLLVPNWVLGKPAAFDLSVTSLLNLTTLLEVSVTTGVAALTTELRKHSSNDTKCKELDWVCVQLVVELYGAWGKEALESISQLASRLASCSSKANSVVLTELYGRLNLHLVQANAIAILARSISQSDVG